MNSNANSMRCPHCNHPLSCSYYGGTSGGRVVQCERCGLRGPKSGSVDDEVDAPLALFAEHCTHVAKPDRLTTERAKLEDEIEALRQQLAAFNTEWQHDPPQIGDTRWVRVRFAGVAAPVTYEWLDEEPAE